MVETKKRGRGRPKGEPSPEVRKAICDALNAGGFLETAITFAGVPKSTFYDWMKKGAKDKSGVYKEFSDAIKRATATAETRYLALIGTASKNQWQAAAWILERRWPHKFARRAVPEGSHPVGASSTGSTGPKTT
jgi:transposase